MWTFTALHLSLLQDRSCKLATFSGISYFHRVNLFLSASRHLWLIKQTWTFFFIYTIMHTTDFHNFWRTQTNALLHPEFTTGWFICKNISLSPTTNLNQASAKQNWLINHKRLAECGTLRWKSRSLFSTRRTINDIVTYVGGTLEHLITVS